MEGSIPVRISLGQKIQFGLQERNKCNKDPEIKKTQVVVTSAMIINAGTSTIVPGDDF
jgi:hypothetical protein